MLKVIAKLGDIPVGATVTKVKGCFEYTVRDRLTIYRQGGDKQEMLAENGCVFLQDSSSGRANAYGMDKEVVWHTSLEELNDLREAATAQ